jgi:hypothetical protein
MESGDPKLTPIVSIAACVFDTDFFSGSLIVTSEADSPRDTARIAAENQKGFRWRAPPNRSCGEAAAADRYSSEQEVWSFQR